MVCYAAGVMAGPEKPDTNVQETWSLHVLKLGPNSIRTGVREMGTDRCSRKIGFFRREAAQPP